MKDGIALSLLLTVTKTLALETPSIKDKSNQVINIQSDQIHKIQ